jgi:hypothetical protein
MHEVGCTVWCSTGEGPAGWCMYIKQARRSEPGSVHRAQCSCDAERDTEMQVQVWYSTRSLYRVVYW